MMFSPSTVNTCTGPRAQKTIQVMHLQAWASHHRPHSTQLITLMRTQKRRPCFHTCPAFGNTRANCDTAELATPAYTDYTTLAMPPPVAGCPVRMLKNDCWLSPSSMKRLSGSRNAPCARMTAKLKLSAEKKTVPTLQRNKTNGCGWY